MLVKHSKLLENLGKRTIGVLVMHKFPILFFQSILPFTKNILAMQENLFVITCACVISIVTIGMCVTADVIITSVFPFALGKRYKN